MTQAWTAAGTRLPLTVLWLDSPTVTHVKSTPTDAVDSLQVSCGAVRAKNAHGRTAGHCAAAGLEWTARHATEFRVTPDAFIPLGTSLSAAHFTPGQYVDITGTTLGKGFQGVMKRWGFGGQPASHGTSKAHRSAGGIGGCQDPGKVWKGKKMAGRMGGVTRTAQCLFVYRVSCGGLGGWWEGGFVEKGDAVLFYFLLLTPPNTPANPQVDPTRNLIYVKGAVPGHAGSLVRVADAAFKRFGAQPVARPFPTWLGEAPAGVTTCDPPEAGAGGGGEVNE